MLVYVMVLRRAGRDIGAVGSAGGVVVLARIILEVVAIALACFLREGACCITGAQLLRCC